MNPIGSLEELFEVLPRIEAMSADGERRQAWASITFTPDFIQAFAGRYQGVDPFSAEYRQLILEDHAKFSGKSYSDSCEGFGIDLRHELLTGFPYGSGSSFLIGSFLIAYGHLIKVMNLAPGASILELGCGLGSLSTHLARSGFQLTCVDINQRFLDLVAAQTATAPKPVRCLRQNMEQFHTAEKYDAIIFFESFHHCLNHSDLLVRLKDYLNPGGCIVLAAEPMVPGEMAVIPYPWGLRLDGETLRAVWNWGWMELGFTLPYFHRLLEKCGYSFSEHRLEASQWSHVILARPREISG